VKVKIVNLAVFKIKDGEDMAFFRVVLFLILAYLAVKLLRMVLYSSQRRNQVNGQPRNNNSLDLSNADVEDVDFEEIEEDE